MVAGKFLQPCANEDGPVGGERGSDINMVAEHWFSTCYFVLYRVDTTANSLLLLITLLYELVKNWQFTNFKRNEIPFISQVI